MSRLYLNDLERIKNGKVVRFSIVGTPKSNSLISLSKIDNNRRETQKIRNFIVDKFQNDLKEEFANKNGSMKEETSISINPERLFIKEYLCVIISTILGNSHCLLSKDGLVTSSSSSRDLDDKVKRILPYVRKLLTIKKETKILDNDFFDDINIINQKNDKVLYLHGGGVFLPFTEYDELNEDYLQQLLIYYYTNEDEILKNVLINNDAVLDRFEPDISKEKVLKLYKDN